MILTLSLVMAAHQIAPSKMAIFAQEVLIALLILVMKSHMFTLIPYLNQTL